MVKGFLKNLSKANDGPYQVHRLVHHKVREPTGGKSLHIICDIDKTYLETQFESPLSLARIPFENALDKKTVQGACQTLLWLRWGWPTGKVEDSSFSRPLHFLSSSPPQLRPVLEEKLSLDGLDWSSDTFKDQVYNIRMGRMDQLRQHVAYKSLGLWNIILNSDPQTKFLLIGDCAESDSWIYLGISLYLDGILSIEGYLSYLGLTGIDGGVLDELKAILQGSMGARLGRSIPRIYIRRLEGFGFVREPLLTDKIYDFDHFYEVVLLAYLEGFLEGPPDVDVGFKVMRLFHNQMGMSFEAIHSGLQSVMNFFQMDGSRSQRLRDSWTRFSTVSWSQEERSTTPKTSNLQEVGWTEAQVLSHAKKWMEATLSLRKDLSRKT